jgi:hypothetical protein
MGSVEGATAGASVAADASVAAGSAVGVDAGPQAVTISEITSANTAALNILFVRISFSFPIVLIKNQFSFSYPKPVIPVEFGTPPFLSHV